MRIMSTLATGLGLALLTAAPALAGNDGATLYPYPVAENYCPAGYQPIVLNGVICCGQPTTHVTYRQVMQHPVRKVHKTYRARPDHCPVGSKGCS